MAASSNPSPLHARLVTQKVLPVMMSVLLVYKGLEVDTSFKRSINSTCVSAALS
jgi:hypothetical protein